MGFFRIGLSGQLPSLQRTKSPPTPNHGAYDSNLLASALKLATNLGPYTTLALEKPFASDILKSRSDLNTW